MGVSCSTVRRKVEVEKERSNITTTNKIDQNRVDAPPPSPSSSHAAVSYNVLGCVRLHTTLLQQPSTTSQTTHRPRSLPPFAGSSNNCTTSATSNHAGKRRMAVVSWMVGSCGGERGASSSSRVVWCSASSGVLCCSNCSSGDGFSPLLFGRVQQGQIDVVHFVCDHERTHPGGNSRISWRGLLAGPTRCTAGSSCCCCQEVSDDELGTSSASVRGYQQRAAAGHKAPRFLAQSSYGVKVSHACARPRTRWVWLMD